VRNGKTDYVATSCCLCNEKELGKSNGSGTGIAPTLDDHRVTFGFQGAQATPNPKAIGKNLTSSEPCRW